MRQRRDREHGTKSSSSGVEQQPANPRGYTRSRRTSNTVTTSRKTYSRSSPRPDFPFKETLHQGARRVMVCIAPNRFLTEFRSAPDTPYWKLVILHWKQWLGPGRLLSMFLAVALLSGGALLWLGWQLVRQDRESNTTSPRL
jgi:hypothetical protein